MKKLLRSLFKRTNTIYIEEDDLIEMFRKCNDKEALNRIAFVIENKIKLIEWREELRKDDRQNIQKIG